jgi:hypothetical protein
MNFNGIHYNTVFRTLGLTWLPSSLTPPRQSLASPNEHVTNLGFWGDPTKFWPSISAYPSLNKLSALQRLPHSKTHTTNKNEKPTPEPARP